MQSVVALKRQRFEIAAENLIAILGADPPALHHGRLFPDPRWLGSLLFHNVPHSPVAALNLHARGAFAPTNAGSFDKA